MLGEALHTYREAKLDLDLIRGRRPEEFEIDRVLKAQLRGDVEVNEAIKELPPAPADVDECATLSADT